MNTILQNNCMVTTDLFEQKTSAFLKRVAEGNPLVVNKDQEPQVLIIKFPSFWSSLFSETANFNANFGAFDFLTKEPDAYQLSDLQEQYV